ncbi:ribonuclease [Erythrobacter sp. QSSC1-22B]|uniref:Rne/Rng family ribonuclease n=1 Tax=Erythrobacter sp. QSSC1-22B TaxID=1860125 RepID=UPI00080485EB|nr:ribonuclease E/G [Erythrobacter sp. QSSC1-22B]OBX20344.1 ribonuclease [Erythrobacter sp. QSSC1-22B]
MATRMLIDARHSEETRVAVLKGNRIEEFDFESADHRQIKGNIYLAKVTRVEPSLQAAFVDFGGNRHGFLAFSEIHPDYYQIPKDDRDALLAAEAEVAEEEERLRAEEEERGEMPGDEYDAEDESSEALAEEFAEDGLEEVDTSDKDDVATIEEGQLDREDDDSDDDSDDDDDNGDDSGNGRGRRAKGRGRGRNPRQGGKGRSRAKEVDDARARRMELRRRYKIQDVIQRRQVLLVQVVKEERGNKGAALTTYLSLAGRYTVLMPNSSHGGGISRKINSANDRKRLKQIVSDLVLPKSMGLIVRTAGLSRTKPEIKRDFDYLARLWDEIREKTLASSAPALIHSDSDLIKRAIRDIYNREIEEVIVEGEAGFKLAKSFMKLLMPSHARRIKSYSDPVPMFQRYGAEDQLKAMYDPMVQLKSGGYLVINPTEALVSIDINSGRSTKEHGIEQTAVATNLEAAREIARQLRLRDMAGLVVIDFIDMERSGNIRKVEREMKDALKNDRARIQVGRISSFGLMEMSRQRLRTGVLEATTRECPHCDGTGLVRTASSAGLSALRLIEDEAAKGKGTIITLSASTEAAVYLLNQKRADLMEIEDRYGVTIEVVPEGEDEGAKMTVSSSGPRPTNAPKFEPIVDDDDDDEEVFEDDEAEDEDDSDASDGDRGSNDDNRSRDGDQKRRRRRGGRNRSRNNDRDDQQGSNDDNEADAGPASQDDDKSDDEDRGDSRGGDNRGENDDDGDGNSRKKRRRGRRGGRGRKKPSEVTSDKAEELEQVSEQVMEDMAVVAGPEGTPETSEAAAEEQPKRKPRRRKAADETGEAGAGQSDAGTPTEADVTTEAEEAPAKPKRTRRKKPVAADAEAPVDADDDKPKQRRKPRARKPAAASAKDTKGPTETAAPEPKVAKRTPKAAVAPTAAPETSPAGAPITADPSPDRSPAAKADVGADSGAAAKPRRGWWQRTFGE